MKKLLISVYYVVMSLPIPVSVLSWLGTLISAANIGMTGGDGILGIIHRVVALLAMLLAGTYLLSYLKSVMTMRKTKKITFFTFLPVLHLVTACAFIYLWNFLDHLHY